MALFGEDRPYNFSGVQALGEQAFGGQRGTAFADQMLRNSQAQSGQYNVEYARERAANERLQRIAAQAGMDLRTRLASGQIPREEWAQSALAIQANPNLGSLGKEIDPNFLPGKQAAAEAMALGDFGAYNAQQALASGKAFEPVRLEDGHIIPSGGLADEIIPTALTEARITTEGARAEKVGRGPAPKAATRRVPAYSPPRDKFLAADPAFVAWQLQQAEADPDYRDGDFAAAKWLVRDVKAGDAMAEAAAATGAREPAEATPEKAIEAASAPQINAAPLGETLEPTFVDPARPLPGIVGPEAPPAGAKRAKDGNFYLPDPARPGKWLLWTP